MSSERLYASAPPEHPSSSSQYRSVRADKQDAVRVQPAPCDDARHVSALNCRAPERVWSKHDPGAVNPYAHGSEVSGKANKQQDKDEWRPPRNRILGRPLNQRTKCNPSRTDRKRDEEDWAGPEISPGGFQNHRADNTGLAWRAARWVTAFDVNRALPRAFIRSSSRRTRSSRGWGTRSTSWHACSARRRAARGRCTAARG